MQQLDEDDTDKDGITSLSSASPLPAHEIYEHIIKSPPEPTRVKSPEQIMMRSPDPVNWIVPLDTGKTFTVTQNVRDGKISFHIVEILSIVGMLWIVEKKTIPLAIPLFAGFNVGTLYNP